MSGAGGPGDGGRIRRPTRAGGADDARLERLSAYLDGWTTDRERAAVERELAADLAAQEALDDLRLVRAALAKLETPRAPRSFALAAAPVRQRPFALFRRLERATRGAAGLAALTFAFALVRAPQATEPVMSTAPVVAQESAAVVPAPVETQPVARARETATQTLSVAPTPAVASAATDGASSPTIVPAAAPAPASAPPAVPTPASASATPAIAPRTLLAPSPTATPAVTMAAVSEPTPGATVEATRFTAAPTPAPTVAAPAAAGTPEPTPAPAPKVASSVDRTTAPAPASAPGTTASAVASDSAGETDVAPALGVLALLLVLLATIQRVGGAPHDEA